MGLRAAVFSIAAVQQDKASAKFLIPGRSTSRPDNPTHSTASDSDFFLDSTQLHSFLSDLLLVSVILLKRLLQFAGDLLEEVDLLTEVVLHLGAEVPYPRAVEVLDLCQSGAGNDVAAVVELALLLWTVSHLGQSTWRRGEERRSVTLW